VSNDGSQFAQQYFTVAQDMLLKRHSNQLDNLNAVDCADAYAVNFQSSRGNVIVQMEDTDLHSGGYVAVPTMYSDFNAGTFFRKRIGCNANPYSWMCINATTSQYNEPACTGDDTCSSKLDKSSWKLWSYRVESCLSEPAQQHCKVQLSTTIAWVVVATNLFKVILLLSAQFLIPEDPLMTWGDAASSFLQNADKTTESLCLMARKNIDWWARSPEPRPYGKGGIYEGGDDYDQEQEKWSSGVSKTRWLISWVM
jgi:hypothetical protein